MTMVTWARHGENLANVTRTLSFRVYDESLTHEADGRNDARSWDTYNSVLDAWRHGDYAARFPGGEDCAGLAARLRAAFTAMTGTGDDRSSS